MYKLDSGERYQIGFQEEGSINMIGIRDVNDNIMYYLIIIVTVVSYILIKLIRESRVGIKEANEKEKNINKYITHSTIVEIIWTIIPALILISIAIPSFKLLYSLEEVLKPLVTLKVTGNQWYWSYSIADYEGLEIKYDSYIIPETELINGQLRLLEVDNRVYLPILTPIRILITAEDVIHSLAVPSLGIKMDAIPGRINQTSVYILREGVYYGQCSELCGLQHAYMPIVIEGVSMTKYISFLLTHSPLNLPSYKSLLASFQYYLS